MQWKGPLRTWCFHAEMDCHGDEGSVGPGSAHVTVLQRLIYEEHTVVILTFVFSLD